MDRARAEQALAKLFEIKQHREARLSRDLAKNQTALEMCDQRVGELKKEQIALAPQWKEANKVSITVKKHRLKEALDKQYNHFFKAHSDFSEQILQQKDTKMELMKAREQLYQDLNRNRIEQEKIKYMREEMK